MMKMNPVAVLKSLDFRGFGIIGRPPTTSGPPTSVPLGKVQGQRTYR